MVERYEYDAYGRVHILDADFSSDADQVSDHAQDVLFAGYLHDAETGLYHVRFRTYHPGLGRWLQRDPLNYVDGLNLFEYVRSNPIALLDSLGLSSGECDDDSGFFDRVFWWVWTLARYVTSPVIDPLIGTAEAAPDIARSVILEEISNRRRQAEIEGGNAPDLLEKDPRFIELVEKAQGRGSLTNEQQRILDEYHRFWDQEAPRYEQWKKDNPQEYNDFKEKYPENHEHMEKQLKNAKKRKEQREKGQ